MLIMSFICPITKLFAWGEVDSGGHVLRETTSRGLCGLVCPSRVCVFITAVPKTKLFAWDTLRSECVFITAVPTTKLYAWG
jgi:hypothetical protein